ncbi:hypothetical protein RHMOL_Rhmol12G0209600 [Rhododendron molle]|uniref:Uncharacterized protein n=1 Tax=Rhododendron molle TaxID=49168 RepID=A0ACC0LKX5_RHOML|nr:hypothetical protein RHMOL_Rhmol12G0209600 [Rhododendron molle]
MHRMGTTLVEEKEMVKLEVEERMDRAFVDRDSFGHRFGLGYFSASGLGAPFLSCPVALPDKEVIIYFCLMGERGKAYALLGLLSFQASSHESISRAYLFSSKRKIGLIFLLLMMFVTI